MSYLALYRKYRPKTFDEVVDQKHITQTLINQITSDKVGHAYLFCGSRGTGKTSTAKIFARTINCMNPNNGNACGKCDNCNKTLNENNIVIENKHFCSNDCASDYGYTQCDICNKWVKHATFTCDMENLICKDCEKEFKQCDICGNLFKNDKNKCV